MSGHSSLVGRGGFPGQPGTPNIADSGPFTNATQLSTCSTVVSHMCAMLHGDPQVSTHSG
eukprot:1350138-Alexandrium_andersonii.AAC.1